MPDEKKDAAERNSQLPPVAADRPEKPRALLAGYEIRIQEHLDTCWFEWFEGWVLTNLENGDVLLSRAQVDPSALHGVLNKIRDLNLTLVSVIRIPAKSDHP